VRRTARQGSGQRLKIPTTSYVGLSENPRAIKILENNKDLVNWKYITRNPNATELLKERAEYERTLTSKQYTNLGSNKRINWQELSRSESIFKIL
jgi:hypothetical protein